MVLFIFINLLCTQSSCRVFRQHRVQFAHLCSLSLRPSPWDSAAGKTKRPAEQSRLGNEKTAKFLLFFPLKSRISVLFIVIAVPMKSIKCNYQINESRRAGQREAMTSVREAWHRASFGCIVVCFCLLDSLFSRKQNFLYALK